MQLFGRLAVLDNAISTRAKKSPKPEENNLGVGGGEGLAHFYFHGFRS